MINQSIDQTYKSNSENDDYLILAKRHISTAKHLLCLIEENEINSILTGSICICIKTSIECIMRHKLLKIGIALEPKSYNLEYLYSLPSNNDFDYKLPFYIREKLSMIDSFEQGYFVLNYSIADIKVIKKLIEETDEYLIQ